MTGEISLPQTPEAEAVLKYIKALDTRDFSNAGEFFTEDICFHGVLYKITGLEKVQSGFQHFCKNMLVDFRVEAVNEAGAPDRYLMMHWDTPVSGAGEQIVADLIALRDGLIYRVDNCLDVSKVNDVLKEDAERVSTD